MSFTLTDLKKRPDLREECLALIKDGLNYPKADDIAVDFYPLFALENASNNHILLYKDQLIAHFGFLPKKMVLHNSPEVPVTFIGGLVVEQKHRGNGLFGKYFRKLLATYEQESALIFLWGDNSSLYNHFHFYECGLIYQYDLESNVSKANPISMDLSSIIKNYQDSYENNFFTVKRNHEDWDQIKKITSANFYKKNDFYCFVGKGGDLKDIIHEFSLNDIEHLKENLSDIPAKKIWSPTPLAHFHNPSVLFSSMVKVCSTEHFKKFVHNYSQNSINVMEIHEEEIMFQFKNENFILRPKDFLSGIFGPNHIEEFSDFSKNLFISGLDSI